METFCSQRGQMPVWLPGDTEAAYFLKHIPAGKYFYPGVGRDAVFPLCLDVLPRAGKITAGHGIEPVFPDIPAGPFAYTHIIDKSARHQTQLWITPREEFLLPAVGI